MAACCSSTCATITASPNACSPPARPAFAAADAVRPESVITVTGEVVPREAGTVNPKLPTGEIELRVADLVVQSAAEVLPMQVAGDEKFPEDIRLRYRFLDLRRDKLHRNIMLRAGRHRLDPPAHDRGRASPSSRRRS